MRNFNDWIAESSNELPWLVIGKGPSFNKIKSVDLQDYQTIALNHSVKEVSCDIFHLIDLDVLNGIEDFADLNAKFDLMPYYPHVNNRASEKSLNDL